MPEGMAELIGSLKLFEISGREGRLRCKCCLIDLLDWALGKGCVQLRLLEVYLIRRRPGPALGVRPASLEGEGSKSTLAQLAVELIGPVQALMTENPTQWVGQLVAISDGLTSSARYA